MSTLIAANTFLRDLNKDFIITLKRKIYEIIKADDDIVKLLKDRDGITPLYTEDEMFEYNGVYPFVFVPEVQTQDKCYICYKVDSSVINSSDPHIITYVITLVVFCSVQKQNTGMRCNRVDAISFCLRDLFQNNNIHGFKWTLRVDEETILTTGYVARTLEFRFDTTNRPVKTTIRDNGGYLAKLKNDVNDAVITNRNGTVIYTDPDD